MMTALVATEAEIPGLQTTDVTEPPPAKTESDLNSSWRSRIPGDTPERDCPSVCAAGRSCQGEGKTRAEPFLHERDDIVGNGPGHVEPRIAGGRPMPSKGGSRGRDRPAPAAPRRAASLRTRRRHRAGRPSGANTAGNNQVLGPGSSVGTRHSASKPSRILARTASLSWPCSS